MHELIPVFRVNYRIYGRAYYLEKAGSGGEPHRFHWNVVERLEQTVVIELPCLLIHSLSLFVWSSFRCATGKWSSPDFVYVWSSMG